MTKLKNNQRITIDKELCNACKQCEKDCTSHAIHIDTATIDPTCILCGHCVAICKQQAVRIDNIPPQTLDKQTITPQQFTTLCAHARTCRHFTSQELPQDILDSIRSNISLYPSASNTRQVQLTIITAPDAIAELNSFTANTLLRLFTIYSNPLISFLLRAFVSKSELQKIKNYKQLFIEKMRRNSQNITYKAPAVLIFHAQHHNTGMLQTDADIWATYTSLLCASHGLGTCFNGFIVKALHKSSKAKVRLGIPPSHTVYISLLIGYPKYTYTHRARV